MKERRRYTAFGLIVKCWLPLQNKYHESNRCKFSTTTWMGDDDTEDEAEEEDESMGG